MKTAALTAVVTILFATCVCGTAANVTGRVRCDGKGVGGVVVSDGTEVTVTNSRGRYRLDSDKKNGYVFISVPDGYETDTDGVIPRFFARLEGRRKDRADFVLHKVDQSSCNIIVFTDLHLTGDKVDNDLEQFGKSFFPDFCRTAESLEGPVYTLCLGDMSTDGKWYKNDFALPEYLKSMEGYPGPIWHVPGNHDNDRLGDHPQEEWDSFAERRYKDEIGPNYYSMNIGGIHFLMLDDIICHGPKSGDNPAENYVGKYGFTYAIDEEQLEWIRKDLAEVPGDKPLAICMHVPIFGISGMNGDGSPVIRYGSCKGQDASVLTDLVSGHRKVDFLGGHWHTTRTFDVDSVITAHTIASASAVSWKLNDRNEPLICDDGTPGGYQIFKVDGSVMSWQYKSIYRTVAESQCSVYDLELIPEAYGGEPGSGAFLVNVFNYDSRWTVRAFEDGTEIPLRQIWGCDPKYIKIRRETQMLPTRPTAFLEEPCLHLFKGVRSRKDSDVRIVLTDRFGNVYESGIGHMAY